MTIRCNRSIFLGYFCLHFVRSIGVYMPAIKTACGQTQEELQVLKVNNLSGRRILMTYTSQNLLFFIKTGSKNDRD